MSIAVQSFPELYTTILGWMQYQNAWDLLYTTGIAYIPFVFMLLKNFAEPYTSMGAKSAPEITMRRIEVDFFMMIFVVLLAVKPICTLNPSDMEYQPVCSQGQVATVGNSGTTYDDALSGVVTTTQVPMVFYLVMAVSEGFTSANTVQLGCTPKLREMVETVHLSKISDPNVRQQAKDFMQQCFVPARSQYLRAQKNMSSSDFQSTYGQYIDKYGQADTEWLGSHTFQAVSGYYDTLHAQQAVTGFAYNPDSDWDEAQNGENPAWGKPTCQEWWQDKNNGLAKQILAQLPKIWTWQYNNFLDKDGTNADDAIKTLLDNSSRVGFDGANSMVTGHGYSHVAEAVGSEWNQLTEYPKIYAIEQAMPIVRALLLMVIYAFLPFVLVFSGYKIKTVITASFIIFSLIYWSFLWHLIQFVDQALIKALYSNWFHEQSPQATMADFIIGAMMIMLPLFWFSLMGAFGVGSAALISGAFNSLMKPGEDVGKRGGEVGEGTVKSAGKMVGSAAKLL